METRSPHLRGSEADKRWEPDLEAQAFGGSWRRRARRNARPPMKHDSVRRPPSSSFRLGFAGGAHGAVRFKSFLEQLAVGLRDKALGDGLVHRVVRIVSRKPMSSRERQ